MLLLDTKASLQVTVIDKVGNADEFGEAHLCDEGVVLEGFFAADSLGISWEDLLRILQHPFVQERLAEAENRG